MTSVKWALAKRLAVRGVPVLVLGRDVGSGRWQLVLVISWPERRLNGVIRTL